MNIIDLFAGCGGFSHGFKMAGYNSILAIEKDLWASQTYSFNNPNVSVITEDITTLDPGDLKISVSDVDGIIGGPPCQGFSLSGNRDQKDPRNSLFVDFVRFVKFFSPKFFVMENVLGILSMKTKSRQYVKDIIAEEFSNVGYKVCVIILNACDYGVPQSRQRVFFIGLKSDRPLNQQILTPPSKVIESEYTSLEEAISDLPVIEAGEGGEVQDYPVAPRNKYQENMRKGSTCVYNHVAMRHTQRLVDRFAAIKFGQSVKHVSEEHSQRKRGDANSISGKVFSQNNMRPYPYKPCPTVAASFQSNFIHPFYNRNFTAREGARIQSFPDTYIFQGKRTTMSWEKHLSQYQQIGNAVPPLLAQALAERISWYFENINLINDSNVSIKRMVQRSFMSQLNLENNVNVRQDDNYDKVHSF
ncbi:DNA (cytosine-5)-methyltransferase 1 [Desulfomicrobium norvegicum]|uniref:Type II methyltransferase M.DdeI n=2 Tax=Desulfomicrobium norvegicum (strain DSM 1741 / NCIMB 8310) TaxID=52561 RepID=MTD1_DESNO|nr:DNA cytosine methyltransferase [Desulfomicrobium norvegicum]P05302.1 RecName: Full=Type II methyltransferase M.DdeI; Short=M.DdeI; AltName: Full=Cytosine-specific methyltransferase DdeI; AltName: Full=Modification methylase DdeI [Desulfomicrobium norvegicum]pir/S00543/ site-specific DNA-methyltransferase (cytosine-specific) (EC 2.1.1.73) DdeI - Desulfovibrio desulfuricans [Desulfovibrio desulfuricans]CAA68505.1 DdeI methylase [Nitratidesulfovibrio vulgaris]SFM24107.1 DNA (cytosine-5)-methylt